MRNQATTVVNLFTEHSAKPSQQRQYKFAAKIDGISLQTKQLGQNSPAQKPTSRLMLLLVLLAHAVAIYVMAMQNVVDKVQKIALKPMMVSLVTTSISKPELGPVTEPPKPVVRPKPIIKKVVEKIKPTESPAERLVAVTTDAPQLAEEKTALQTAPMQAAEAPKAAPVVEDKQKNEEIVPPRFGVSYLNNPAPDYPAMSRRLGEEGRVSMKVLVSAEGAAAEVEIEKSSGSERLDKAAMAAVKQWRFIPANKNNQPLSAYVLVPIKFALDK